MNKFLLASKATQKNANVNYILTGANVIASGQTLKNELTHLFGKGQFELHN